MSASTSGRSASATPSFCEAASSERIFEEKCGPRLPSIFSATCAAPSHFCHASPPPRDPFPPPPPPRHEVHGIVVQQDVARQVIGLLQVSFLHQLRAGDERDR